MKTKMFILLLIPLFILYITYNSTYKKIINIVSINSLNNNENYNYYLSDLLSKSQLNYNYNIDYSNDSLEIENLVSKIDNNSDNIQSSLHKANIIILSIGNIDYKEENLNVIINELNVLFKRIRAINNKQIYYISPSIIKNTNNIKELCHKNDIIFLNGSSFKNKNVLLSQLIFRKIESVYNQ